MAEVLISPPHLGEHRVLPSGWWPVDVLLAGYLAAAGLLIAGFFKSVPHAALLLAAHAVGIALILALVKSRPPAAGGGRRLLAVLRHWYPLVLVTLCYRELVTLIPAIRHTDLDAAMVRLDHRLWGSHPTVWLERVHSPWLTEGLQWVYTLFIPAVLLVGVLLWVQRRYPEFRYYAFLISLGFLASYLGYLLVPVRGPRISLAHLQHTRLGGLWLFEGMQRVLNQLESAHYDCFPSGHTELTLLACWSSRRISMKLFAAFSVYSLAIIFATVYLRYHYTVDVLAGAVLAAALLVAAPIIYAAALNRERRRPGSRPGRVTTEETT